MPDKYSECGKSFSCSMHDFPSKNPPRGESISMFRLWKELYLDLTMDSPSKVSCRGEMIHMLGVWKVFLPEQEPISLTIKEPIL